MSIVWLNGAWVEDAAAGVSLHDTGLLHGAGVFTTMRAYGGRVFRLEQHLARLRRSCEHLFVPLQYRDAELTAAVEGILQKNGLGDARVRLTVTRGASVEDPLHGMRLSPNAFLTAAAFEGYPQDFYERGLTVIVLDEQRLNPYDIQAGHKTLNYFSRVSALRSAQLRQAGEALMFDVDNYLQSGATSNVFLVRGESLVTPPTPQELEDRTLAQSMGGRRSAVVPGVTRQAVIDLAREAGVPVALEAVDINALLAADEVFLTNSVMGIMPVCRIEKRVLGGDRPGPVTMRLGERYAAAVARRNDEIRNQNDESSPKSE